MNSILKFQIPAPEHAAEAHTASIYALQVHSKYMVTASQDKTIRRWDLNTGRLIPPVITGCEGSVLCLQFDERPDHDILVSGGVDGALRVYKFSTGDEVAVVANAHEESVLSLSFDDRYIVTGSKDKGVRVWNRNEIRDKALLPQAFQRASNEDGIVKPLSKLSEYATNQAAVNAVQLLGDTIIVGSGDRTVQVLKLDTGDIVRKFNAAAGVADLHFNGRLLLAGSSDGSATIWDINDGSVKARLEGPRTVVRGVDAVDDENGEFSRLAIGKYDGTVQIYEKDKTSETWTVTNTLEYGIQPERISDDNPYVHTYPEGERVFDVSFHGDKIGYFLPGGLDILSAPKDDDAEEDPDRIQELMSMMNADQPPGGEDIMYGPHEAHRVRYWKAGVFGAPLILFVHGGSWRSGTYLDSIGSAKVQYLLDRGYAFATVNYQLVPTITVEEQAQEVADALAFLASRASELEIDPQRLVLLGHSSGAHIAALLGTDSKYLGQAGLDMASLRRVICIDGSNYNALAEMYDSPGPVAENTVRGLGTDVERLRAMSPTFHAQAPNAAAFLLLHVQRSGDVRQAMELAAALSAAGSDAELHVFEGQGFEGHIQILLRLGMPEYPATLVTDNWLSVYAPIR
ncbi:hypothetical protein PRZ48_005551 [Zasmidium cellare]|uniref:BD-FAE-like domain-containing protein n=1 Tax=Zasmidium cellare TaxID=395010 RepID=A0ABR0ELP6_ZASCE|nr:hypothetical protein PRZ48_005551 [Zasmidium cellare]